MKKMRDLKIFMFGKSLMLLICVFYLCNDFSLAVIYICSSTN